MLKITYTKLNIQGLMPKERRAAEHQGGRALLLATLEELGLSDPKVALEPSGKPYLEDSSLHFSLAHSDGLCVCAVSDKRIGVDVESLRPMDIRSIERLSRRMFTPEEQRRLAESGFASEVFLTTWVQKEAIVKRSGVGITGLRAADTAVAPVRAVKMESFVLAVCPVGDEPLLPEERPDTDPHK